MKNIIFATILSVLALQITLHAQQVYQIPFDGNTLHFKVFGTEGPAILIINGGPGMNSEGFSGLARLLSEKHRTITYDQRGTGKSVVAANLDSAITLNNMVRDIEAIREHLKLEQWVVLGHSFGGMLASYYATLHPERIQKLVLSSSGGIDMDLFAGFDITRRLNATDRDSFQYWSAKLNEGDTTYATRLQRAYYLAPAYLYNSTEHRRAIAERLTQVNLKINGLVFQNMQQMGFDCKAALKTFNQPVLIIQGRQDIISEAIAKKANGVFPRSQFVLIDQCAHYGWMEQPKQYIGAIEAFLR